MKKYCHVPSGLLGSYIYWVHCQQQVALWLFFVSSRVFWFQRKCYDWLPLKNQSLFMAGGGVEGPSASPIGSWNVMVNRNTSWLVMIKHIVLSWKITNNHRKSQKMQLDIDNEPYLSQQIIPYSFAIGDYTF